MNFDKIYTKVSSIRMHVVYSLCVRILRHFAMFIEQIVTFEIDNFNFIK